MDDFDTFEDGIDPGGIPIGESFVVDLDGFEGPIDVLLSLARLERVGILIVLAALFILPWIGGKLGVDLNVFWWLVGVPTEYLMQVVFSLTGHG